ncbi:DUF362 domain-containing protein [Melioribacter sp. Ez-97]|jgi:uncharacterized protein (DUF362 family)|uniref:DUF362 domain-containing protein n=1 Tax=Melioribacter sp. Ez-97 TaxID=3423434 RepID=UPI003EDAA813
MKRRDFIIKSLQGGILLATSASIPGLGKNIFAAGSGNYDLVAVKGGAPGDMFDKGIASMGGLKKFVKPNSKVVIKPNIGWDTTPERAANTNPELVYRVVKRCLEAGAKEVYVFDHTCDDWRRAYSNSGIEKAVKDAGGTIVPGNSERYYHDAEVKKGKLLKQAKVHELILESDVLINMPILKHHGSARITVSLKNLMGVVWDRGYWHRTGLHQCIADFGTFRKPDLNIVDAYYVMKKNGPRGVSKSDVVVMKSQIISTDPVAADSASALLFGIKPDDVPYITIADSMGLGVKDLKSLNIDRIVM